MPISGRYENPIFDTPEGLSLPLLIGLENSNRIPISPANSRDCVVNT
jgi:hypothetical protein